jgi:hypothetical protein
LVNEPGKSTLDRAIKSIKLSVALRQHERPFRQARYYDFNVWTEAKRVEKLRYMHRNPVVRGLAEKPEVWQWSSFRHYATGLEGAVEIESSWAAWKREHGGLPSQVPKRGTWGTPNWMIRSIGDLGHLPDLQGLTSRKLELVHEDHSKIDCIRNCTYHGRSHEHRAIST